MVEEVDDPVGVTVLVVVPGDQLDKVLVELDAGLGVEDGGGLLADKVGGHDLRREKSLILLVYKSNFATSWKR